MVLQQLSGVSVVVPCCNEEDAIIVLQEKLFPVLDRLAHNRPVELVLVDDGSRDRSWALLSKIERTSQSFQIQIIQHPTNRGLGAALQTGSSAATNDIIVTLDADGTYPFSIVETLVGQIDSGADVVTASPYHPRGGVEGVSALRLVFSRGASMCYRIIVDRHVHTWTAMVRAYRSDVLFSSISPETGFLHVAMTLVEARRRGAGIVEVPAILSTRRVGQSKARVAQITRSHLRYMTELVWLRLTHRFWVTRRAATSTATSHG